MAFKPITSAAELDALDGDLIVAGCRAGLRDQPDYTQREQAYWHGYLNGQVDSRRMPTSAEQAQLARTLVGGGYFKDMFGQLFGNTH
jgi:hypothetical protein